MRHFLTSTSRILALLLFAFSLPESAFAQKSKTSVSPRQSVPSVRFTSGDKALQIPLEIDNNIILMQVRVNNSKPLRFIFDTGASVSVIDSKHAKTLGLKSSGQESGDATGGPITVSIIKGASLSVAGAEVSNQPLASMALPMPPGFEFDGIIGYHFIKEFVVEIDYLNKVMNLYRPQRYRYSGTGEVIPLLLAERETPLVIAKFIFDSRGPLEAKLELDTGGDGTFRLNSPLVNKEKLLTAMPKGVQETARGAGGEQQRVISHVKAAHLGHFIFNNPPVALALDTEGSGASKDNDGIVGGEILRRFKVILDYSRSQMILEPNKSFNDPYDVEG